jgi:hypothetical protein
VTAAGNAVSSPVERRAAEASAALPSDRFVPLGLAAMALALALLTVTPWPVGVFQDDAIYVVLAKSLASGDGFRMINMPGAPHATHFPPGYPLLLAALWKVYPSFPDNIVLFKFANALFLAAAAFGTYRFSRSRLGLGSAGASIAAMVGTISVVILLLTGVVMSEPLYMALLIPTLLAAERTAEKGGVREAALAGVLVGVLSLIRTVGVFALPAAVLVLASRRRWREAVVLGVAAMAFVVPWQLWVSAYQGEIPHAFVGKYGAYGAWLAEGYQAGGWPFARVVLVKNANALFGFLGYMTLPVSPVLPRLVSLGTVIAVLGLGAISVWRRVPVTLAFLAVYGAVILVWPFEPMRFAFVWWPVLAGLFVAGVRVIWAWRPAGLVGWALKVVAVGSVLLVAGGYGWYNARGVREKWWVSLQRDAGTRAKPIAEWVTRATRPDDVVITDDDLIVYLYTGRRALPTATFTARSYVTPLTARQDAEILRSLLEQFRPRWYIAAGGQSIASAQVLVEEQPAPLRYAGSISTARVYEPVVK